MQNSQYSNQSSHPTVAKLLEVDAELAAQELQLNTQLQSLKEKRQSLQTVITLFSATDSAAAAPTVVPAHTLSTATTSEVEPATQEQATPELASPAVATTADETQVLPDIQLPTAKKTSTSTRRKQTSQSALTRKLASRKTESWQQYLRAEFSQAALSEAVAVVLQRQPQEVWEIAAVVDAIFVDEMPTAVSSKARDRVSNVLSEGVRKDRWYRTGAGSYSMSAVNSAS